MRFSLGDCCSESKVNEFDDSIVSDHDVIGLYIAMRDSVGVEIADRLGDLQGSVVLMR